MPRMEGLYCGFEDAVEVFDVNRPGEGTRLPTTPFKKSKDGLKGIISALAFVPAQGSDMYAAGSLSPTSSNIAMFNETHGAEPVMFVSGGPPAGVTQISFNPARPHIMYAAYRRHGPIYSWDLRANVDGPMKIFKSSHARTNQKLRFDIDLGGRWLGSGDESGNISMFDLQDVDDPIETEKNSVGAEEFQASSKFDAHGAFHPHHALLLSASGSRHFHPNEASESSDSNESMDSETDSQQATTLGITRRRRHPVILDASIKTWLFDSQAPLPKPDIT
ncbi:hypothetical protein DXG03_000540 [Asterophora parasitica]|uniref:Uncharacterized protein n=1 Tax=Asterophora parasitica TaxID=117018 RepID=A0A9P7GAF0_9AGAR|nr:hypothetical protein DXG03_000540 [Asterophora parasitica]